jgi:hypothetical protein
MLGEERLRRVDERAQRLGARPARQQGLDRLPHHRVGRRRADGLVPRAPHEHVAVAAAGMQREAAARHRGRQVGGQRAAHVGVGHAGDRVAKHRAALGRRVEADEVAAERDVVGRELDAEPDRLEDARAHLLRGAVAEHGEEPAVAVDGRAARDGARQAEDAARRDVIEVRRPRAIERRLAVQIARRLVGEPRANHDHDLHAG